MTMRGTTCISVKIRPLRIHVSNIRQKIKAFSDKEYIRTVWGVGFKLAD